MTRQATGPSHWPRRRKLREPKSRRLIHQIDALSIRSFASWVQSESAGLHHGASLAQPLPFLFSSIFLCLALPCLFCPQIWGFGWQTWLASVFGAVILWCGRYFCLCPLGWCGMDGDGVAKKRTRRNLALKSAVAVAGTATL